MTGGKRVQSMYLDIWNKMQLTFIEHRYWPENPAKQAAFQKLTYPRMSRPYRKCQDTVPKLDKKTRDKNRDE